MCGVALHNRRTTWFQGLSESAVESGLTREIEVGRVAGMRSSRLHPESCTIGADGCGLRQSQAGGTPAPNQDSENKKAEVETTSAFVFVDRKVSASRNYPLRHKIGDL